MTRFLQIKSEDIDKPIYRIISFYRLVEHFTSGKLGFVRTEKWDDPFENYIASATYKHGNSTLKLANRQVVHGSCWTKKSASDAMWRIYSPDKVSVRISTTPRLLGEALETALAKTPKSQWYIGKVVYLPQSEIIDRATSLAENMLFSDLESSVAKSYLFKRKSFSHEDEVRALVLDRHQRSRRGVLALPVDPHKVIKSVLIDSRAPDSTVQLYKSYLKNDLGFKGRVTKSTIYSPPEPLVVHVKSWK